MFDESKHPRDGDGKFTDGNGGDNSREEYRQSVNERIKWAKDNDIDLPMNTDGSVDDIKLQEMYDSQKKDFGEIDEEEKESPENSIGELLGEEFKTVKGQAAVDKLLKEKHGHVKAAFHREDIGDIDLVWGNEYLGLQHIITRREEQGIDAKDFVGNLSEVIEKGNFRKKNVRGNFEFIHNGKVAVISPELRGNKIIFLLTAFKTHSKK